jgi:hypothetical protein
MTFLKVPKVFEVLYSEIILLYRVEPLLYNDREISKITTAVSRQQLGKHVPAATDTHAAAEVLLETVFYTRSMQRGWMKGNWGDRVIKFRMEVRSNTSTVILRVVGGDENGTQCLGV